jgi:hypothetical protein
VFVRVDALLAHSFTDGGVMTNNVRRSASVPMLACTIALLLRALAGAPIAGAQLPTISGGTHVRVHTSQRSEALQGTLVSQTADSIGIVRDNSLQMIPAASVVAMDVGSGRSHTRGAYRGAKMGTLIVGGTFAVILGTSYATYDGPKEPADLVGFIAAFALSGAFYGAIIGGAIGTETWAAAYPRRVAFAVQPQPNGATGLGMSLKF